ncbi:2Fe-2S iron-sulfur cluster-binding protein [Adlercreutzia sp. CNCM I-6216]
MSDSITAKVFKFDPVVDSEPHYETYEVPWLTDEEDPTNKMTGMQVLQYINDEIEPISYDCGCIYGLCGRCSMTIDGEPGLACWTTFDRGTSHTFEPLNGLPIVKDLVVEREEMAKRFVLADARNKTVDPVTEIKDIDYDLYWNVLERMNLCRECLCCYANCNALQLGNAWDTYLGPGGMMQIAQRYYDPHDQANRVEQAAFSGVFDCVQCGNCTTVCPAAIPIAETIAMLQQEAEKAGLKPADTSAVSNRIMESMQNA